MCSLTHSAKLNEEVMSKIKFPTYKEGHDTNQHATHQRQKDNVKNPLTR